MDLRERDFPAELIATKAKVETIDSYEKQLSAYQSRNYTYIPLPEDAQFYNIREGWLRPLEDDQWITPEKHLLDVLELLQQQPFLLYKDQNKYWIINIADINKRGVREMLYPPIAELESLIASRIQDHHPESKQMIADFSESAINPQTIGSWYQDRQRDVELHIAEYMNLTEMKQVLTEGRTELFKSCGFSSKDEIKHLHVIRDLRNKVMHVNRSLVRSRTDIKEVLSTIDTVQELILKATGKR